MSVYFLFSFLSHLCPLSIPSVLSSVRWTYRFHASGFPLLSRFLFPFPSSFPTSFSFPFLSFPLSFFLSFPLPSSLPPLLSPPDPSPPLFSTAGGGRRNSRHVVIGVEKHGAIVIPSLKSSVAVFHVTNALQSRVLASLPGL